jgi:subtilisin family serine protease
MAAGQQRRALLSKNSVTSMFSAQSLWAAGYLGQGVKMGVFDTGIREDHPHVKNIKCAACHAPRKPWPATRLPL